MEPRTRSPTFSPPWEKVPKGRMRGTISQHGNEARSGAYANIHSCSAALWNFHVRVGPAITFR